MVKLGRLAMVLVLVGVVTLTGCKKKKPPVPPPQAQAPTITAPPPAPTTEQPATTPPENKPAESKPATTETKPAHPAAKPRTARKTPAPAPGKPTRTIVENTPEKPATPPQISAGLTPEEATHQRSSTQQLLDSTDANLRSLGNRQLTGEQQSMVQQIRSYMQQSRQASTEGDLERARNLALKAHLLSDELVKQ